MAWSINNTSGSITTSGFVYTQPYYTSSSSTIQLVPAYVPPVESEPEVEDELAWLCRRVREITDLIAA